MADRVTDSECQVTGLKGLLRVFEKVQLNECVVPKFFLNIISPLPPLLLPLSPPVQVALDYAGDFSLVSDLLRAKIFVTSLVAMSRVLRALAAHPHIRIVKIKNRVG